MNILFLNENPLPKVFTKGTISAKELRLRSALQSISKVHVLAPIGHHVHNANYTQTKLETKIVIHPLIPFPYYLRFIPLFIQGIYLAHKYKVKTVEAESPIISGPAAIIIGKLLKIPTIIEIRASYYYLIHHHLKIIPTCIKQVILNLVLTFAYSQASILIANSLTYQKDLKKLGFNSTIINPGLQSPPKITPKIYDLKSTIYLGFLGRLVPEKGVDLLIQAIKLLPPNLLKKIKVEITGDGPEFAKLKSMIYDLRSTITFLGFQPSYQTLQRWHLMINPCLVNHPLEMANAEAAYMGVPVICFGNKNIPETVINNSTGIKVKPKTAKALSLAIQKLISKPKLLKKLSQNCHQFAVSNYSFDTQVKTLKDLYNELLLIK